MALRSGAQAHLPETKVQDDDNPSAARNRLIGDYRQIRRATCVMKVDRETPVASSNSCFGGHERPVDPIGWWRRPGPGFASSGSEAGQSEGSRPRATAEANARWSRSVWSA